MNLDDESQISAFFDDELDPGDRLLVAWSIESSPASAQQLADLKASQGLIRGLDRPAIPRDLSPSILKAITPTNKKPRLTTRAAARIAAALIGVGSIAASLVLALTLLHRSLHDDSKLELNPFVAATENRTHPLIHPPLLLADATTNQSTASIRPGTIDSSIVDSDIQPIKLAQAKATGVDGPEPARPGQVDAMLGHRKVLRALIVADVLDQTSSRVRSFIEKDPDREPVFGRITLTQGIVVDPDRPGEAEVYSVVMSEPGCGPFLDRLRRAFPSVELEGEPEPTLVTQLTEVGQVAVFSGVRPARLGSPPGEISSLVAARAVATQDHFPPSNIVPLDPTAPRTLALSPGAGEASTRVVQNATTSESLRASAEPFGGSPPGSHSDTKRDHEPVTVLVWVTRSSKP